MQNIMVWSLSKINALNGKILKKLNKIYISTKIFLYKLLYGDRINFGKDVSFRTGFKVIIVDKGSLKIGQRTFFNHNCSISCLGEIQIGNDCLFGEHVKFYDHNHRFDNPKVPIAEQGFKIGKIKIGNNCWFGSNVTILNNVTIGDNVIIGANCLIYHSIPSNTIVKNNSKLIIESLKQND